jgi:hypothetical protein
LAVGPTGVLPVEKTMERGLFATLRAIVCP